MLCNVSHIIVTVQHGSILGMRLYHWTSLFSYYQKKKVISHVHSNKRSSKSNAEGARKSNNQERVKRRQIHLITVTVNKSDELSVHEW